MKRKILSAAAVGAAVIAFGATAAGPASAQVALKPTAAPAAVNTVKVSNALLRAQPNTSSTKLDVAQIGQGIDLYCWVNPGGGANYVWFKAHPWGSKFTGWMRADLIHWATYPSPFEC